MTKTQQVPKNIRGIVSILVTMVMMTVITIMVLTYAQIIRREQRQTLDRQLSSQAYYAAESAANAVFAAIDAGADPASIATTNSACDFYQTSTWAGTAPDYSTYKNAIPNGTNGLEVTCLHLNTTPSDLRFNSIARNTSKNAHFESSSGNIDKIEVSWEEPSVTPSPPNALPLYDLPPETGPTAWGYSPGILRLDVVPFVAANDLNDLYSNNDVVFLYPHQGGGPSPIYTYTTTEANKGSIQHAKCNGGSGPKNCTITIDVSAASSDNFYLRIRPIYRAADVVITAYAGGTPINATSSTGQIVIDVTARSQDVLRRVSFRRSASSGGFIPSYAIDSTQEICKKIDTSSNAPSQPDPTCKFNGPPDEL